MGWATTPFQSWVAKMQWCHDRKGRGVHRRRAYAHDRGLALTRVILGRPIAISLLGHSVVIEKASLLCIDREFSVATGFWVDES